jgi:hypothetical protein
MKKMLLVLAVLPLLFAGCFSVKIPLTAELVINGGYYKCDKVNLFPEEDGKEFITEIVNCYLKKEYLHSNLITWVSTNNYKVILDKENKVIFSLNKIPVGSENFNTPVGKFKRSKSEISFNVVVEFKDSTYRYSLENFYLKRRVIHSVDIKTNYALGVGFYYNVDVQIKPAESQGTPNYLHWNRVNYLVFERNSYVDLIIKERKTVNRMKDKYIQKINYMDSNIEDEIGLHQLEYDRILQFIDEMNKNITKENFF